jgi:hypothetical protein
MKTKTDVLRYVLTTSDRGFTHRPVNGFDVKMNKLQSALWRLEIFLHLVIHYIKKEIK